MYALFLIDLKVLPEGSVVVETSGSTLAAGSGVADLKNHLDSIKNAGGGVIFLDEAYQLSPKDDRQGRQVLDFILTHSEKLAGSYGRVAWVVAGYADRMDKLFEYNPGLPSRFPFRFVFEDYSDAELLLIFKSLLINCGNPPTAPKSKTKNAVIQKQTKSLKIGVSAISNQYADQIDDWGNTWKWNAIDFTWEDRCVY
jgi:hypothetical protein